MAYILIIVLFVLVLNLRARISTLESLQGGGMQQPVTPQATAPQPAPMYQQPVAPAPMTPSVPSGPAVEDRFIAWLKEDWIMKLGAFLLLIGFGWLVSYAFLHNWIGPAGRVALGIGAGFVLLAFGWYRMRSYLHQGAIFLLTGAGAVLLTVFKAQTAYGFFSPQGALVIMFATAMAVGIASVVYRTKWIALLGLALAAVAPFLSTWPGDGYVWLFMYFFIVTLGTLWIVIARGWRDLTTAALVILGFYSASILSGALVGDKSMLLLIMYAFTALFFVFTTAGIAKAGESDIMPDIITAAGSGLLLLWWILAVLPPEAQTIVLLAWAIIFLVGGLLGLKWTNKPAAFYAYSTVSVVMIGAATAAKLHGQTLVIAYAVEAAALYFAAYAAIHDHKKIEALPMVFILPIMLSLPSIGSSAWNTGFWHKDLAVLAAVGLSLLVVYGLRRQGDARAHTSMDVALVVTGSVYAYIILWLVLHAAMQAKPDLATMVALITYAVIGITCYFTGLHHGIKGLQAYGGVLLAFVVGRVLFVDVWKMQLTGRIITFFALGILLMSTAFLGKKKATPLQPSA